MCALQLIGVQSRAYLAFTACNWDALQSPRDPLWRNKRMKMMVGRMDYCSVFLSLFVLSDLATLVLNAPAY